MGKYKDPSKIKDCGTCRFQNVPAKTHPCSQCGVNASGYTKSLWKPKGGQEMTDVLPDYVFLDIDGVLTSERVCRASPHSSYIIWAEFDPVAVKFLNRFSEDFAKVEFVLSSTWRNHIKDDPNIYHWIESAFRNAGFQGTFAEDWKVNMKDDFEQHRARRGYEIKVYLDEHPHNDFMIFDDNDYDFQRHLGVKRHIMTHPSDGMLSKHMQNAWSLANQVFTKRES